MNFTIATTAKTYFIEFFLRYSARSELVLRNRYVAASTNIGDYLVIRTLRVADVNSGHV